jgi:hypothetical protein
MASVVAAAEAEMQIRRSSSILNTDDVKFLVAQRHTSASLLFEERQCLELIIDDKKHALARPGLVAVLSLRHHYNTER